MDSAQKWWKNACVYQIYPASFKDSSGSGTGDLPGILSKLDYVKSLGVDAIWISPFFESPDADMGYDISDYQKPSAHYGTLADVDAIIKGCHDRGLKILFDLVINHTSNLHRWFKESEKSKDNPYRKYYHWRPPRYNEKGERIPPTNWKASFGGSTWEYSPATDEYYLHLFTVEQPDLNWEDAEVRKAIYAEAVTFWLERGVDGFRIDTSGLYSKFPFKDVPITDPYNYEQEARAVFYNGPRLHEFIRELNEETFSKYGAVTIAETPGNTETADMLPLVAAKERKYDMAIRFNMVYLDHFGPDGARLYYLYHRKVDLRELKRVTAMEQELADPKLDCWLAAYTENHDQARSVSRFADDSPQYCSRSAKMLCIYLTCLSGTLLLYEGQEIGMRNIEKSVSLDEYIDPATILYWKKITNDIKNGLGEPYSIEGAKDGLRKIARDHARTPMQWDDSHQAGFSTAEKTWMRVTDTYREINVKKQEDDPSSVLNLWRKMLKLRKQYADLFVFGCFVPIDIHNEKTFRYAKTLYGSDKSRALFVALNFTGSEQPLSIPKSFSREYSNLKMLAGALDEPSASSLAPWEGRVYLAEGQQPQ